MALLRTSCRHNKGHHAVNPPPWLSVSRISGLKNGKKHIHSYFWHPHDTLMDNAKADRAPYDLWNKDGHLFTTPGKTVDYSNVVEQLPELLDGVNLVQFAYDRSRMSFFQKELERANMELPLKEFGQGFMSMAPAIDALESDLLNGNIVINNNPVLTMCAANTVVTKNGVNDRKFEKQKARGAD